MKDYFEKSVVSSYSISSEFLDIVQLVADAKYAEALESIDEYMYEVEDVNQKNIAALMSLQILVLCGYKQIASVLLKSMLRNFKAHSKARDLCLRTISELQ